MGIDAPCPSGSAEEHREGLRALPFCRDGRITDRCLALEDSWLLLHDISGRSYHIGAHGTSWQYEAQQGSFDYYPAGRYDLVAAGPRRMQGRLIRIPVAFENAVLEESGWSSQPAPRHRFRDGRLAKMVEALGVDGMAAPDSIMLSVALVDRIHEVITPSRRSVTGFSHTVRRLVAEYIDVHLDRAVRPDRIAVLTGLAPTQFMRTFKATFGRPLHQYVIVRKVQIACARLPSGVGVAELAYELGFSSHAHFSTVFRRLTGVPPSRFRHAEPPAT